MTYLHIADCEIMMHGFNLLDQGWLGVRRPGGEFIEQVGVLETLLQAGDIEELLVDLPTQFPAVLRQMLLPIVVDALGSPVDRGAWAQRFSQGRFSDRERDELAEYLEKYRDRFDLFHMETPFGQVAGLRTAKNESKGSALLVATAATGNNVPLFASRTEGDPPLLTPGQAARWLVHTQCWDTAAIKTGAAGDPQVKAGKTTGNPTGPLGQLGVVIPIGRTLYETLLLNTPIGVQDRLGAPQWTRPAGPAWETRAARGLLDLWTWQSRRIRLIPEQTAEGLRVTRVVVAAGDRLAGIPDWEPHTAWRVEKPVGNSPPHPPLRPLRLLPGKAVWRGLDALLAVEATGNKTFQTSELLDQLAGLYAEELISEEYPLRAETFAITYGNQAAVIEDVMHDMIPLPVAALRADGDAYLMLLETASQAEGLATAVNYLSADLRRAAGMEPIPWDKGQRPGERLLHLLDPVVRRLLNGLQKTTDEAVLGQGMLAWEQTAHRLAMQVADSVFTTVPESVFAGREAGRGGSDGSAFRLGTAVHNFRRQIDRVLPRAAEARRAATSPTPS